MEKSLDFNSLIIILLGIGMGTIARLVTLRIDTRQNPSYPTGYFINIVIGSVASALGAVAIPALLSKEFTAVTFIALAIQHFRDIRKSEKESLEKLEGAEYAKRGAAYIDGISKTYESRNYLSMLTALFVVMSLKIADSESILINIIISFIIGTFTIYMLHLFTKGKSIGDICNVKLGKITIEQSELFVDGMFVTNFLGTERSRELFLREGIGIVIEPKNDKFRLTIENPGQRQAMVFEATRTFGVKRFSFSRRSFSEGKLMIAFVPIIYNAEATIRVIKSTPVLESSRKIHTIMDTKIGGNTNG
ncbi:YIEGIA domain-containing protein [Anaeropeptidivorans aminofermentans]|uniref:YIEGIA domain-containing protein n=1 Tax=Anaeropeptidivorans aminofermentans TaxID=2934315 RepID=UPI002025AC26|nr:YIEGIA domain-containing protein [Anaeropeptidivorans aminofermentans]MBE6011070.1 YIEGIA protein [Lachnospiraceae bacterium]